MIVGKVTQADERTKAVTMVGKGGEKVTLNFSNPKMGTLILKSNAWASAPRRVLEAGEVGALR